MFACYVDESGDTGAIPTSTSNVQPVLCILGLTLPLEHLKPFTFDFLDLKARFFPGKFPSKMRRLDRIQREIKGAEIRSVFRSASSSSSKRHHHIGFLDNLIALVEKFDCSLLGRVWIKEIGAPIDQWAIYTSSIQAISSGFNDLFLSRKQKGMVILDSRSHTQDKRVAFSIITKKFSIAGDGFPEIVELPTFGQSDNHAGIQVADLICSALLFPIAAYSYCSGAITNVHVSPGYSVLKSRYGSKLQNLQHQYLDPFGKWKGGIVVSDPLTHRDGSHLFR